MSQKISALTDQERQWIATQVQNAATYVDAFSPADAGQDLTLAALDRAFAAWLATNEADNQLVNGTINCVGIAFGEFLVSSQKFNWAIVADRQGTDLALHALPGKGDVIVFPANFVAKRWEQRESNFMEQSYAQILAQVDEVSRTSASHTGKTPWWKFW